MKFRPNNVKFAVFLLATCTCCSLAATSNEPPPRLFPQRPQRGTTARPTIGSAQEVQPGKPQTIGQGLAPSNRSTRTADVFQNGEGYNIFVTNTCDRDSMKVNIKTSRPFFGVIHTRGQRQKKSCTVEANGDTEYNLEISHALNPLDPAYCGVIRARRDSPKDKDNLSVVVAVRVHRSVELSDDKFFLLNCTYRCVRPDCSSPNSKLIEGGDDSINNVGSADEELTTKSTPATGERESPNDECTIWKFPWMITLLWCLGILLLAMIISHCIMCSSMVCRCVKTEVEEREPSEYEGATDYDDDDHYNKKHPYQIEYDNRDVYKTTNNYSPYKLDEVQAKSRQKQRKSNR